MVINYVHIQVTPETKQLLLQNCIKEFLAHNPQFIGVYITHDMILRRVINYYLDEKQNNEALKRRS